MSDCYHDPEALREELPAGITAPRGFLAAAGTLGLKKSTTHPDLALVYSAVPAMAAGVFTRNRVQAAPVLVSRRHLQETGGYARAIVANSGNANACTGYAGLAGAEAVAGAAALALGLRTEEVLISSTGVIGVPFPAELVAGGVRQIAKVLSRDGGTDAARAIMTTDTRLKEAAVRVQLGQNRATIGGMAKGSGMIHPNMGTMLAFLTTDAAVTPSVLGQALAQAVDATFNMVSVDGDTSTNDTVVILANGLAGNRVLDKAEGEAFELFVKGLHGICRVLARMIAADGEGATKLLTIEVRGAGVLASARAIARTICCSNLVKTAVFGRDANWGRIMMAAGCAGVDLNPDLVDVYLAATTGPGEVVEQVAKNGAFFMFSEERAGEILAQKEVSIILDLNQGSQSATAWGCDLSYEYVRINGAYRT